MSDANSATWNVAAGCHNPVYAVIKAAPNQTRAGQRNFVRYVESSYANNVYLDIYARCRKCVWCLKQRQRLWTYRARAELQASSRTWFGTFTLSPHAHYLALCQGVSERKYRSIDPVNLNPEDEWAIRTAVTSQWLTLYLKRIRKASGAKLRYLLVCEKHKSGLPHWHILLSEALADEPVRHSTLTEQWPHGFTRWKLVDAHDNRAAHYACKYLSKSADARVRASVGYGQQLLTETPLGHRF